MRVFVLLGIILSLSVLFLSTPGFAQQGERGIPGYCPYGCGPYVPLLTTPSLSFRTVSANPVGATDATGGLSAGATNATISEINGNTSTDYTIPVWYSGGGTPLVAAAVNSSVGSMRMNARRPEFREPREREKTEHEPTTKAWVYFASAEPGPGALEAASAATGVKTTKRTLTNEDVQEENQKNGYVHYDSKTEKIQ